MKLSDYIVEFLAEKGTDTVFGYIGGAITHLVDSIDRNPKVRFVQVYHEQTAAFAAEGYSRNSTRVGVAIATSGPGATNLITGIGDAYFDSIPALYITGQVNTYEYKYDKNIRQQGFQETDIVSIVKPITKYAAMISDPKLIRLELEKAFHIAHEGRPGPVLLDIPMDVQRAEIDPSQLAVYESVPEGAPPDSLAAVAEALGKSKRPILLAGGGVINSRARESLAAFARRFGVPLVCSLMGKGAFAEDDPLFVGMIGSYGNRAANMAVANADLLLAVGTRLDTRQTGTLLRSFLRGGDIVHVDIDPTEINEHRIDRKYKLRMDADDFLRGLSACGPSMNTDAGWLPYLERIKREYSQESEVESFVKNPAPYRMVELVSRFAAPDQLFFADIGQNQMWAAQMLQVKEGQKFFTSGGMAPMGYAIPAAIGASFACGHKQPIYALVGDGGLHISTQALLLLSQYKLPIKVILLNNRSLGMITVFQDLYFNENKAGTTSSGGYLIPDFQAVAKSCFLPYHYLDETAAGDEEETRKIFTSPGPALVECFIGERTTVSPKLEFNNPLEDPSPKLDRERLKRSMLIDFYESGK